MPWIIQVGPECHLKGPCKKKAEGDVTTEEEEAV